MRHVGLVALEALLVAIIVWVTTMALAGASQSGGLIGSADAGRTGTSLTVGPVQPDGTVVLRADPSDARSWIHMSCRQGDREVSRWARADRRGEATVRLDPALEPARCLAEVGYFSGNGKWRVTNATAFDVAG
jgi:hypothetical protein